jgi:hypothetical protein
VTTVTAPAAGTIVSDFQEFLYRVASQVPFEQAPWANERGAALMAQLKQLAAGSVSAPSDLLRDQMSLLTLVEVGSRRDWSGMNSLRADIYNNLAALKNYLGTTAAADSASRGLGRGDAVLYKADGKSGPARFVAVDLVGGEPIVQRDGCMPEFATWASVEPAPVGDDSNEAAGEGNAVRE